MSGGGQVTVRWKSLKFSDKRLTLHCIGWLKTCLPFTQIPRIVGNFPRWIFSTIHSWKSPFAILSDSPVSFHLDAGPPQSHNNIWPSQSLSARPRADRVSWRVTLQWHSVWVLSYQASYLGRLWISSANSEQWAHLASCAPPILGQ
mgnify:CR=1 FL=1